MADIERNPEEGRLEPIRVKWKAYIHQIPDVILVLTGEVGIGNFH